MNIALLGYGKMGKTIEQIAIARGHKISLKIDQDIEAHDFKNIDVAIDFSVPSAAFNNISYCLHKQIPVISGTTGWLDKYPDAVALCNQKKGAFIYASNFSLGVNIFFELNRKLAQLMQQQSQYEVTMEEVHHTQKLDAPSGTAISLAKDIIDNSSKKSWTLDSPKQDELVITAKRIENVPGTHTVHYHSDVDAIEIKHTAHNRSGFALGAVIAAEWILGKTGVFTMKDVLNIG